MRASMSAMAIGAARRRCRSAVRAPTQIIAAVLLLAHLRIIPDGAVAAIIIDVIPRRVPVSGGGLRPLVASLDASPERRDGRILCRIDPPDGGTTHVLNATAPTFPGSLDADGTEATCGPSPAFVAEGPGLLVISVDGGQSWIGGTTNMPAPSNRVTLFRIVDAAFDRRPYCRERTGHLLLRRDASLVGLRLSVEVSLPALGSVWRWTVDAGGGTDVALPFDLEEPFPSRSSTMTVHNDAIVRVTGNGTAWGERLNVTLLRRFHRVPPPPPTSDVQVVQVDHSRAGLLVDGLPWNGVGWYVGRGWNSSLPALVRLIRDRLAARGINQGMVYGLSAFPPAEQLAFLDDCHAANFKVMYDLGTGEVRINHGGPFDRPELLKDIISNVTLVKDHPALLGYYICDDCCSNQPNISLQGQAYQLLKFLDPYHVTIGAVNCGNSWMFTDTAPSYLTPQASIEDTVLPQGKQPQLQLSLDVIMQENYDVRLARHTVFGDWSSGVGSDGFFRHGVLFEPLVNCPSPNVGRYAAPKFILTASWLGVITASMYSNLVFVYNEAMAGEDWRRADPVLEFAWQVRGLLPAIAAPFGSAVQRTLADVWPSPIAARAWTTPNTCNIYIVVANSDEGQAARFGVRLVPPVWGNATRLFDAGYNVSVSAGRIADWIDAGSTNIYEVKQADCAGFPRASRAKHIYL